MILQLFKVNHFLRMLFGYDSSIKLELVALHKLDQSRMEVRFLVICLVALAEIQNKLFCFVLEELIMERDDRANVGDPRPHHTMSRGKIINTCYMTQRYV